MMRWCICLLAVAVCSGTGGIRNKEDLSGFAQFWTDDYKVFDQIYGKTSDKEIFGASLPPASVGYGIDPSKLKSSASDKKERFIEQQHQNAEVEDLDAYGYNSGYAELLKSQNKYSIKKPFKSTKFIPPNYQPIISKETDPETYNYLSHLEQLQKKEQYGKVANQANLSGFKPFLKYNGGDSSEEVNGYKSIQEILVAHEANKGKSPENIDADGQVKYLTTGRPKTRSRKKEKPSAVTKKGKYRCPSGRCRKRNTVTHRGRTYLSRPLIRKIKHKIYSF